MLDKIKELFSEKIELSRAEEIIKDMNDTDKSIKVLKRLRIIASPVMLNIIGIALFIGIFTILNIFIRLIDFAKLKVKSGSFSYPFYKFLLPNFEFMWIYIIMLIAFIAIYIKLRITIKASFETLESGQKGSSRLTTPKEIEEQYIAIAEKGEKFKGRGGVPISRYNDKIYIDITPLHTIVIGTTRSGKGQGFVLITIDIYSRAETQSSLVINDPKGELCGLSKEMLEKQGYEVKVIDFFEMHNSIGYNPLQIIKDAWRESDLGEAELRCRTFTFSLYHDPKSNDKTWEELSMNLVNALILALCEKCLKTNKQRASMTKEELEHWDKEEIKVNLFGVANMLSDLGGEELDEGTAIDIYFDNLPKESIAKRQYNNVKFAKSKTRASIFVSAMQKLQVYMSENVAKLTSFNDLKLEDIGFYKNDSKKMKIKIVDIEVGEKELKVLEQALLNKSSDEKESKVVNKDIDGECDENNKIEDKEKEQDKEKENKKKKIEKDKDIKLYNVADEMLCYKNQKLSNEMLLNRIKATGIKGQDLTDEIVVNSARVEWGSPGTYEVEYSVSDKGYSKPIALFIIVPDFDRSNHVLATTCISQITYMLSRKASLSVTGKCDREVVFILDEAGNMCPIENFATTLTVSLGRGIKYIPILQSFAQVKEMYGENYKTLIDNCANTLYIKTTDVETAEDISKMSGEKTIVANSRTGSVLSFDKSITEVLEQVPVIRYDDLIHIKEGETAVIRPMYRNDLQGNRITPYPIFNTEEMGMKFKYEYLEDVFSKNDSMRNIYIRNSFNEIELEDLKVDFDNEMVDLVKKKVQSIAEASVKKELLREQVKRELSGNRNIERKSTEKNENNVRRKVKDKIRSNLQSIISDDEINIINEIEDRKELECHLIGLKEQGKYDESILNKLISILNK